MIIQVPTFHLPAQGHGLVRLTGADRATFLHNLTTADVKGLAPGQSRPAAIVNQRGQVIDWVGLHADDDALWVTTSPGRTVEVLAWLDRYLITEDVAIVDESASAAPLFVSGAGAADVVGLPPWSHGGGAIGGLPVRVLGVPGWGGPGYLVLPEPGDAEAIAAALTAAGAPALDGAARAYWRVAAGVPEAGRELTERTNPWEARLDDAVSLAKGCYLGQEVIARLRTYDKVQRLLVGLDVPAGAAILPGSPLRDPADPGAERPLGEITSVALDPGGGPPAVLGLVKRAAAEAGTPLIVQTADGGEVTGKIADRWFWSS